MCAVMVDIRLLREAFLSSGESAVDVAMRLDWKVPRRERNLDRWDSPRVRRALGIRLTHPGHGYPPRLQQRINCATATKLAAAIGVDPYEVGL